MLAAPPEEGQAPTGKRRYRWNHELCPLITGFIGVGSRLPAGLICVTFLVR
jgi:hypothetical protein